MNRPIVRPNPWNQKRKEKEFLAEQFPGVDQFFIGSADYVSDNFVRLHIGSKLSPSVFNSGLDQVPYLKGKKAYLYDGVERIGDGKVTGLLGMGRDNFVEIQDPLTAWPRFRCPTIVIPVKDFPRDNPDRADPNHGRPIRLLHIDNDKAGGVPIFVVWRSCAIIKMIRMRSRTCLLTLSWPTWVVIARVPIVLRNRFHYNECPQLVVSRRLLEIQFLSVSQGKN